MPRIERQQEAIKESIEDELKDIKKRLMKLIDISHKILINL